MFLIILTLTLCLTKALVRENFEVTSPPDHSSDPIYNVNGWVGQLHLQRCALVAIGLKYFAVFVEDEILGKKRPNGHRKFFMGICQQEVLEQWKFCSPDLSKRRKHKCRFRLKADRFQPRVHRRFCDFKVLVNNKDCKCAPSIFGDQLIKVEGLPTCYFPPLPNTLCKYNVCGLNQCTPTTVEDGIHTVNCSSKCKGKHPFCEVPLERSSRPPESRSSWSKWRRVPAGDVATAVSVAACINKYNGRGSGGGLDCLGPGTGCCPRVAKNCTCETFEENGTLKVKRTVHTNKEERSRRSLDNHCPHPLYLPPKTSDFFRYLRDTKNDDDNDLEDDDDVDDDLDEDIVLKENPDDEKPIPTTEEPEKDEILEKSERNAMEEIKNKTSASVLKNDCQRVIFHGTMHRRIMLVASSCIFMLIIIL